MLEEQAERLIRLTQSPIYRTFGFGIDGMDFAKSLLNLHDEDPSKYDLLNDLADRILFIDFLRFEIGWQIEDKARIGRNIPVSENINALETYLLCTVIDTMAGGRQSISFDEWLQDNPAKIIEAFQSHESIDIENYLEITKGLFCEYRKTGEGLTRKFIEFFKGLPDFLKEPITDSIIVISGNFWSERADEKIQGWLELPVDEKVKKVAGDYLYSVRRSKYTHRSETHVAISRGSSRRATERGQIPTSKNKKAWSITPLYSAKNPDKVKYTVISDTSQEEGYILRAVISFVVLTDYLNYSLPDDYLDKYHRCYSAISAIYAFLHEMRRNIEYLDFLIAPKAVADKDIFEYHPVDEFSVSASDRLLRHYGDYAGILQNDIKQFLFQINNINGMITNFNAENQPGNTGWEERRSSLFDLSKEIADFSAASPIRWYYQYINSNLKRHVENGQIFYRFTGIIPNRFSK